MCAVLHCRLASHGLHGTRQTVPEAVRGQSLGLSAHCSRGPARLLREVPRARRRTTAAAPTPTPRWRRAPASHCPAHPVAAPSAQPAAAACPVAAGAPPASPLKRPSNGVALSGCAGRGVFSFAGLKAPAVSSAAREPCDGGERGCRRTAWDCPYNSTAAHHTVQPCRLHPHRTVLHRRAGKG